jgi:hypothetical protein
LAGKMTPPARSAADTTAKRTLDRALKIIGSDYQDFGDYSLVTTSSVRTLDRRLGPSSALRARGRGTSFTVSIRSASGTRFSVHGDRLRLSHTCSPAGMGCPRGHWYGANHLVLPKVAVITTHEKAIVSATLSASVTHYSRVIASGERILGSEQYADAAAGLAAFNNPNSAASRFRDFRVKANVDSDLSYDGAFRSADSHYTAANEPPSISTWQDDMELVPPDISAWESVAAGWQIRRYSTNQLRAAENRVEIALARARRDISSVVAGR